MLMAVIERVNRIGKNEPSILTFTNRHGEEIGDTTQDFYPGVEDESDINQLTDDLQEWTTLMTDLQKRTLMVSLQEWTLTPSPQEWRLKLIMVRYMNQFPKSKETMVSANKSLQHQRQPLSLLPYDGRIA